MTANKPSTVAELLAFGRELMNNPQPIRTCSSTLPRPTVMGLAAILTAETEDEIFAAQSKTLFDFSYEKAAEIVDAFITVLQLDSLRTRGEVTQW